MKYTARASGSGTLATFDDLADAKAWAKDRNGRVWRNCDGHLMADFANYY
jgi:hypothetical protein